VEDGSTGILFSGKSTDSLINGLEPFRGTRFDPFTLRASALRFLRGRFLAEFSELVNDEPVSQVC
jgi:hypothetical protein